MNTEVQREAVERASKMYNTNREAAQALQIATDRFARLCRQWGIKTSYLRQLRARMEGRSDTVKIALVENDQDMRSFYSWVLTKAGYEVVDFAAATPALESCNFKEMDLIITGLAGPTRGKQLIKNVRAQGIQAPILAIGGYAEARSGPFKVKGAQEILKKPFGVADLLTRVQKWV
jgi:CheY-like chemotaxis protein